MIEIPISRWEVIDAIEGCMSYRDCCWLATAASHSQSWTEIGVWNGRSLLATGLYLGLGGVLQAVDVQYNVDFWPVVKYLRMMRPDVSVLIARCDSERAAGLLQNTDVVFIDADHPYEKIVADIHAWRPKCATLCGHDYLPGIWDGVVKAVDELVPDRKLPAELIWTAAIPWEMTQ